MKKNIILQLRKAVVPLAAIETADPDLTIRGCMAGLNGKAEVLPLLSWDIVRGLVGLNKVGKAWCQANDVAPMNSQNPVECLGLLEKTKPCASEPIERDSGGAIVFFHNGPRMLQDGGIGVIQALWNLRDTFKAIGSIVILLGPVFILPAELKNDVVVMSEDLPTGEELRAIVRSIIQDAGLAELAPEIESKAVDALLGLSGFAAEQALSLSITKEGLNLLELWERKRKMIEQTPGLSVWRGGESFDAIGGCENVKGFMRSILAGNKAPRAIVFIDEIEKALSGAQGDLSGVSQDYLGALLTFMQDRAATGCIFIGPPGAAKSAVAKATGNAGGIPTISFDLGAMKGSLVGQSEQQIRNALKVCDAVSQGQTLFIATCNSFANLPPELKRRFTLGTFFFDLPKKDEREKIWDIYLAAYGLDSKTPPDNGWTGAEIKQCCDIAFRLKRSLLESAKFVVPVSVSAKDAIQKLRREASGKFIDASTSGLYEFLDAEPEPKGRKFAQD